MYIATSFLAGLIFGIGLIVSQMVNPAKILAFLDVAGDWDPSLAFVMGGALTVTAIGYRLLDRQHKPVYGSIFQKPGKNDLDVRLIGGAAVFGIGWGLAGLCPGPALVVLSSGANEAVIFCVAMIAGMAAYKWLERLRAQPAAVAGDG